LGKGWQNAAGEAVLAAIDADLAFEALAEILKQVFFAYALEM
jgi:hypothetical protein